MQKGEAMRISIAMIGFVLAVMPAAAQKAPSTNDIFEMRRKCQMLAEQRADWLTPNVRQPKSWTTEVTSNFSTTTYHCYLLSEVHPIEQSNLPDKYILLTSLHDGITNDLLANYDRKGNKVTGTIWDRFYKGPRETPDDVREYIDKMMNPQR